MAGWLVLLARSGRFPQLGEELNLSQLSATQVTLTVELNPCLGQRGSFCSPVKYSAFPKSPSAHAFRVNNSKCTSRRLIIRYPTSPHSLHTCWVGFGWGGDNGVVSLPNSAEQPTCCLFIFG